MNLYAESSAVLAWLLDEAQSQDVLHLLDRRAGSRGVGPHPHRVRPRAPPRRRSWRVDGGRGSRSSRTPDSSTKHNGPLERTGGGTGIRTEGSGRPRHDECSGGPGEPTSPACDLMDLHDEKCTRSICGRRLPGHLRRQRVAVGRVERGAPRPGEVREIDLMRRFLRESPEVGGGSLSAEQYGHNWRSSGTGIGAFKLALERHLLCRGGAGFGSVDGAQRASFESVRASLGAGSFERARGEGRAMLPDHAIAFAWEQVLLTNHLQSASPEARTVSRRISI